MTKKQALLWVLAPCLAKASRACGGRGAGVAGACIQEYTTMAKLNDTQLMILSAASQRRDFSVYPLPKSVKNGDGPKHLKKLLSLQMIEEVEAVGDAPVWRVHEDGYNVTLILADEGFRALGVEREKQRQTSRNSPPRKPALRQSLQPPLHAVPTQSRRSMIALLQRPKGTTIDELAQTTGWQKHSVHGVMSGVLRKKLGLNITSEAGPHGRTYRIVAAA
jgi:predicted transcriptional regulator